MQSECLHVYLMPGMAANSQIFEYIKLPEKIFKVHRLEWILPLKNETLQNYAERMCELITHENPILIGVSFGGILVQEMSRYIKAQKIVVVSSVKHHNEFPMRFKLAKKTKLYKLLPTQLAQDIEFLSKYVFGETAVKRVELYKKYLSMSDKRYLDWALDQIVNWEQSQEIENLIHIHGNKDKVFPVKYLKGDRIEVNNGTHVMIINKYKWFNENLPELLTA